MKNEKKIRGMLGNKYHLCSNDDGEWVLKNEIKEKLELPGITITGLYQYFSKDNKAIMSYKTNTEEDLYEYLKAHREWNLDLIMTNTISVILFVIWIIAIINIFKHSDTVGLIIAIGFLPNIIISLVMSIVRHHNIKVRYRDLMYNAKRVRNENSE